MNPAALEEYAALRATIRERGTARILLFWLVIAVWGALATAVLVFTSVPAASLVPFLVLVAGFEAIVALHLNVERIGRFIEVNYERTRATDEPGPAWETTVMSYGRQFRGRGADPMFGAVFTAAAVLNLMPVGRSATAAEWVPIVLVHAWLPVRVLLARWRSAAQPALDAERFAALVDARRARDQSEKR